MIYWICRVKCYKSFLEISEGYKSLYKVKWKNETITIIKRNFPNSWGGVKYVAFRFSFTFPTPRIPRFMLK